MVSSEEEMRELIGKTSALTRYEGQVIPEGLSLTATGISNFWYLREGDTIAILHERFEDNHVCFEVYRHA